MHDETLILPIHEHLQLHASQYKQKLNMCGLPYNIAITTNLLHYPSLNKLGKLLMELRSEILNNPSLYPKLEVRDDIEKTQVRRRYC